MVPVTAASAPPPTAPPPPPVEPSPGPLARGTAASTTAAARQNPKYPADALTPISVAPAAPGNPTTDSVCPAKLCRRSTMNQPTQPASTATIAPARNALTMNGYAHIRSRSVTGFQEKPADASAISTGAVLIKPVRRLRTQRSRRLRDPRRGFGLADHDEPAVGSTQHLDRGAVEAG